MKRGEGVILMKTHRTIDTITKPSEKGYTVIELITAGATIATLAAGGEFAYLGGSVLHKYMNYDNMYNEAAAIADTNNDSELDREEARAWFKEMGVIVPPGQDFSEVRPSYDKLKDFVEAYK
jgi:hypothetical protein